MSIWTSISRWFIDTPPSSPWMGKRVSALVHRRCGHAVFTATGIITEWDGHVLTMQPEHTVGCDCSPVRLYPWDIFEEL